MNAPVTRILFGCLLVAIGLAGGWYAARQGQSEADSADAAAQDGGAPTLSEQTLKNIGVEIEEVQLSDFVHAAKVQATVVDAPLNARPVAAPLGGLVTQLHVEPGQVVKAGHAIATVAREAIPRPSLSLTSDILTPVSEGLHEAVSAMRTAVNQRKIVETELARIRKFTTEKIVPRQTEINLEYDLARAKQQVENARRELELHGLSAEEITAVLDGALPPGSHRLWKRALEQNGLWGEAEEALLNRLPERARTRPWSVAAIGELSAAGLSTSELETALREVPHLTTHFVEVASLLLQGHSIGKVRLLCRRGAFEPMIVLRAPADGPEDWDVAEVGVRPGQRVDSGATVALLHDPRTMWLRLVPVGEEVGFVAAAVGTDRELRATPLLAGSGPVLENLRMNRLESRGAQEEWGSVAYVVCRNEPIGDATDVRSWKLRVGLRYLVHVPKKAMPQRFVLPASAVTTDGPDRVVFLEDGTTFKRQPVHVEYEDDEVVVIANDGSIFPGDPVVTKGAFALGLALRTDTGQAVDSGHGHVHGPGGHTHG